MYNFLNIKKYYDFKFIYLCSELLISEYNCPFHVEHLLITLCISIRSQEISPLYGSLKKTLSEYLISKRCLVIITFFLIEL